MSSVLPRTFLGVAGFAGLAALACFLASDSPVQAGAPAGYPRTPPPLIWTARPEPMPPYSVLMIDKDSFKRSPKDWWIPNITNFKPCVLHNLKNTPIEGKMTSLKWHLPPGFVVRFYERCDLRNPGRTFTIWGSFQEHHLKRWGFLDCVRAWSWCYVGP